MSNLKNYNVLKILINSAKLELKGDAIIPMASSISWFNSLESVFVKMDKEVLPEVKPIKNGKKNVNK